MFYNNLYKYLYAYVYESLYATPRTPKYYNTWRPTYSSMKGQYVRYTESPVTSNIHFFSLFLMLVSNKNTLKKKSQVCCSFFLKTHGITGNHGMIRKRMPCFSLS